MFVCSQAAGPLPCPHSLLHVQHGESFRKTSQVTGGLYVSSQSLRASLRCFLSAEMCARVCVFAGSGLLPGHESDYGSAVNLHE